MSKRSSSKHSHLEAIVSELPVPPRKAISFFPKTDSQKELCEKIEDSDIVFVTGPAGTGKAQPLYSKVLTPNGWINMGDIKVGDVVTTPSGGTSNVVGVFPQGVRDIYELTFYDGRKTRACKDHLWRVYSNTFGGKKVRGKIGNHKIITTQDILRRQQIPSCRGRDYVELVSTNISTGADQVSNSLIPPYLLGLLIGDGCLLNKVNLTSVDESILQYVSSVLHPDYHLITRDSISFDIVKKVQGGKSIYVEYLRMIGLNNKRSYEKAIPENYLNTTAVNRLQLLKGLMDTDGTAEISGGTSFCTTSAVLAAQVQYLVRSLGGIATIGIKHPYFTYKGVKKKGRVAYNVNIRMKIPSSVFELPRKKLRAKDSNQYSANLQLRIDDVSYVGKEPCQCIMIDSPDHLYITDDFIVTHNTFVSGMLAARELNSGNIDKIVVTRPAVEVDNEKMGFLPGELEEKFAPWFEPFRDVFEKAMGSGPLKYNMKIGVDKVVPSPMAFMRGKSYDNTWIIMDEAQNCTREQMKMLLTRIGKDSKIIILGDIKQSDIHGVSGLEDAIRRLDGIPGIASHEFTKDDIVRHGIIRSILERYEV